MNYYLGPYQWVDDSWQPPPTTVGSIDLRNLTHMGTPAVQDGYGFFATTDLMRDYDLLGRGDLREISSTSAMKSMWNSLLGYNPQGDKLVDLLYNHLTIGSDPVGALASRPILPAKGNLTIHLGGHSPVKSTQFRIGHSPETNQVITVFQNDYREIRELVLDGKLPTDHHRKVLDFWGDQFRINPDIFIPDNLPKETRLRHDTSISDNFDGADNAAIGKQLTWVEPAGDNWENINNHGAATDGGITEDDKTCYANSALSGADQECQATTVLQNEAAFQHGGVCCRRSSVAVTCYGNRMDMNASDDKMFLFKIVTGTLSVLGSQIVVVTSIPDTLKMTVAGSSLEAFLNGVSKSTVTDSAITGNLFCGLYGRGNDGENFVEFDNWSAADFIAPTPAGASALLADLL